MNRKFNPDEVYELDFSTASLNTDDRVIIDQVNKNIRRGLPQARPYQPNDQVAVLVAGGPSLAETERDLVESYWAGGKIVTVNGAYDWCIARNIKPSAQVLIDAREFNSRFVERPVVDCHYLLASQCHPKTFELCQDRRVTIWHCCSTGDDEFEMLKKFYFGRVNPVVIGTTVTIRAISLLRMLGFMRIEIFGLDSCVFESAHHAYSQPENDGEKLFPVWLHIKDHNELAQRFICSNWQAKQAVDFQDLIRERSEHLRLRVHGPGLIATMVRLGAEMTIETEGE